MADAKAMMAEIERRKALEARKAEIVAAAMRVFGAGAAAPEKSQLQNLRSLAASTDCREELVLFIRYQAARLGRAFEQGFAEAVIANMPEKMDEARLYLGYVYRHRVVTAVQGRTGAGASQGAAAARGGRQ